MESVLAVKGGHGITVERLGTAVYTFRAPEVVSTSPTSGPVTGGTNLTVSVEFPGRLGSYVGCLFNGVYVNGSYVEHGGAMAPAPASARDWSGMVVCPTPHLRHILADVRSHPPELKLNMPLPGVLHELV